MEPRANRPPPLAPSIPIRPAAGADASSLQLTSSSTTSSSSSSPPDFLRHINAAFKRHRPLGTMNVSRASRVLVPSADPSKRAPTAAAAARVRNVGVDVRKEGAAEEVRGGTPEDSSITPPSVTETAEGLAADRNASLTPETVTETVTADPFGGAGQRPGGLLPERVPGGGNAGLDFHGREGQLRGHEGEFGVDNQGQLQGMKLSVASSSFENREELRQDQHYVQPVIRSSVAGATCATTMSLHTGPTYQCTRASAAQTSCVTQMSSNAPCIHEARGVAQKEGDGVQDHREVAQLGGDLKDKGVSGNLPAMNSVPAPNGSSPPPKTDKASRKKKYDPDMFFKVNGKRYQKLGKIGSGGSSEVYKVISADCNIYALKKIKLKGRDYPTAFGFCQEIEYLNRLKGKGNIIQLIDYEVTDKFLLHGVQNGSTMSTREGRIKDDQYIYMVLEYGEIDLAHMLSQKWKEMDGSSWKMDENWLRFYWQQMLEAVNTIHEERIVHSDLKPANFLLVRGSLKLIDFGIAKAIMTDTTNIQRDAQVGTLNYMSPEAFMWNEHDASGNTIKCGRSSDIWSLGCILYQMVYGKTPFAEYKNFWAKFKVITDKNHEIEYEPVSNPWLVDLMRRCLAWERNERWRDTTASSTPISCPSDARRGSSRRRSPL